VKAPPPPPPPPPSLPDAAKAPARAPGDSSGAVRPAAAGAAAPSAAASAAVAAAAAERRADASALVAAGSTAEGRPLDLPSATAPTGAPKMAGTDNQPGALRPQAAQPTAPKIQRRPPSRRLEIGDLICPECGEGNPDSRKFCSRCGTALAEAQVVKKKWWQRFIPRKGPKKRKAGDRPSARKTKKPLHLKILGVMFGGVARVVGAIFIIGGILYGMVPNIRSSINEQVSPIKNWVTGLFQQTYGPINITGANSHTTIVNAKGEVPGQQPNGNHAATMAIDTHPNTWWLSRPIRKGRDVVLHITFGGTFNVKKIRVYNGDQVNFDDYDRPQSVVLVWSNGKSSDVTLVNDAKETDYDVSNGDGVKSVDVHIKTVYRSTAKAKLGGRDIALAEIFFLQKT
jgi:hypothetical protein